MKKSTEFII